MDPFQKHEIQQEIKKEYIKNLKDLMNISRYQLLISSEKKPCYKTFSQLGKKKTQAKRSTNIASEFRGQIK